MVTSVLYDRVSLNSERQLGSLPNTIGSPRSNSSLTNLRPSELAGLVKKLEISYDFDLLSYDRAEGA
jgi:hypothetical protein